jgi:hypothetical protein
MFLEIGEHRIEKYFHVRPFYTRVFATALTAVRLSKPLLKHNFLPIVASQKLKTYKSFRSLVPVTRSAPASDFDTELFTADCEDLLALQDSRYASNTDNVEKA